MRTNTHSKLATRDFICNFIKNNEAMLMKDIINALVRMGYKRSTSYNLYYKYKKNPGMNLDRKSNKSNNIKKNRIVKLLKQNIINRKFKSYRSLAKKAGCDHKTVKKYLDELKIIRKVKKIIPKVSKIQKTRQNSRLKIFVKDFLSPKNSPKIIMDDECYFSLEDPKWADKYYYEKDGTKLTHGNEYIKKTKFPYKVMMWISISENGKSEPVFFKGISSINTNLYVQNCLPVLKSYINTSHRNDNVLFWPDLASCHTSETTKLAMENLQIRYLPKENNPPNCPQIRPIEKMWAYLKRNVYKNGKEFDSIDQLISRIKYLLNTLDFSGFEKSMKNLPLTIRKAQRKGLSNTF